VEQRGEPWERREDYEKEDGAAGAHGFATVPDYNGASRGHQAPRRRRHGGRRR
jgi:hypothetical protein